MSSEIFPIPPGVSFANALQDAAMLEPDTIGSALLFDSTIFEFYQEGEGSINNGGAAEFVVPAGKVLIIINVPYGKRQTYMTIEDNEDWSLSLRLRVMGNTGSDLQDFYTRMQFATMHRGSIFSLYGIYELGQDEHPRMRPYDARLGFAALDYTLRFRWDPMYSQSS